MKKTYLLIILIGLLSLSFRASAEAQVNVNQNPVTDSQSIENFKVAPNPATGNKIYITSKENKSKIISIYNVLGERVMFEVLIGKELNISQLTSGLYVMKCVEGERQSTLKLFVDK